MDVLGMGGGFGWWPFPLRGRKHRSRRRRQPNSSSSSSESIDYAGRKPFLAEFPLKQASIAASLTLTGDTVAQLRDRFVAHIRGSSETENKMREQRKKMQEVLQSIKTGHMKPLVFAYGHKDLFFITNGEHKWEDMDLMPASLQEIIAALLSNHDWLRALRIASYGFLLYGPGSYVWYQFLDHCMPDPSFLNLSTKVILNQIVLGPCVIGVIFAWNNFWLGKLAELPSKYQKDALPTLLYGFRFWIPVSIINFTVIPITARVAFMSTCSIFWNFYLSSTMSK